MGGPNSGGGSRRCAGCGNVLAFDNNAKLCSKCYREQQDQLVKPPQLAAEFFDTDEFRAAFASWHIGKVFKAYRHHPRHLKLFGKALNQELLGRWLGLTQAQVSRTENGKPEQNLETLRRYAETLHLPPKLLWFDLPNKSRRDSPSDVLNRSDPTSAWFSVSLIPSIVPSASEYGDADYLESVRSYIKSLVSLENRFGAADLVRLSVVFFDSLHDILSVGAYAKNLERDLNAVAGELAEVVGWLAYDAEKHELVRRMNQESLHFTRLAGDRNIELLTIQNASMHAGATGRPAEALQLARSVLEGSYPLSPRLRALFLTRQLRARAQMGDDSALASFGEVRSLYLEGVDESDPPWAWWVDERELTWHEAMAKSDLKQIDAVEKFHRAVEATAPREARNQYLHRAYLLRAQIAAGAWSDVEATIGSLVPLVSQVASRRTENILRQAIVSTARTKSVPDNVVVGIAQLGMALEKSNSLGDLQ